MFYRCPNCSELLKKGVNKCPFCGRVIDMKDLENIQRREEKDLAEYEDEYDEEVKSRFKGRIIFSIVFCILFISFFVLMLTMGTSSDLFMVLLIYSSS
ncbi:MAG: zinc ribbon domain-containing protein [Lachnospiraceae bacterium]|nr:zinc ribbon domain-containing protein [Lachnospiraceae bacterium]